MYWNFRTKEWLPILKRTERKHFSWLVFSPLLELWYYQCLFYLCSRYWKGKKKKNVSALIFFFTLWLTIVFATFVTDFYAFSAVDLGRKQKKKKQFSIFCYLFIYIRFQLQGFHRSMFGLTPVSGSVGSLFFHRLVLWIHGIEPDRGPRCG